MDWVGWAILGFVGTIVLTGAMVFAHLVGWTRMDIPHDARHGLHGEG